MTWRGKSWAEVASAWQRDAGFREAYSAELATHPSPAFAWETAPVSAATRDAAFDHVIVDSPMLARVTADVSPFAGKLGGAVDGICTFANLGGDATLVVPAPDDATTSYPHLAAFVRAARPAQVHALWAAVGAAVEAHWRASDRPVWVSTAGLGVYWLHVRLDSRPKYYRHAPFRRWPRADITGGNYL